MTDAYLRTKTDQGWDSVEVEYLSPAERRRILESRSPEELMRWMDLMCEKLVEAEKLLQSLAEDGLLEKPRI